MVSILLSYTILLNIILIQVVLSTILFVLEVQLASVESLLLSLFLIFRENQFLRIIYLILNRENLSYKLCCGLSN